MKISMSPMTFDVLYLLVSQAPANLSIDNLMQQIWKKKIVGPETVTQRIALLRKALSNDNTIEYIESIRGEGYRWLHAVHPLKQKKTFLTHKQFKAAVIGLLFTVACGLFWILQLQSRGHSTDDPQNVQSATYLDPTQQLLQQGDRYYQRFTEKDTKQALAFYQKAHALSPNSVHAMVGISKSYSQMVSKYHAPNTLLNKAEQFAQQALNAAPGDFSALYALGFSSDVQGYKAKAIDMYEKALMIQPNNKQLMGSIAYLYGVSGNLVEALRFNLLALDGEHNYRHLQTAKTLYLLGFDVLAENWYQRADELNPDSVFAAHDRAQFYFSQTQLNHAKEILDNAQKRNIKRMELHILLGQIAFLNNDQPLAEREFKLAERINPQSTSAKIWSMWLKSQSNQPLNELQLLELKTIEQRLQEIVALEDYWPQVHINLALIEMVRREPVLAIEQLKLAYKGGFLDTDLLLQIPAFDSIKQHPNFTNLIESMHTEVKRQRLLIASAQWLPDGFLDPGSH